MGEVYVDEEFVQNNKELMKEKSSEKLAMASFVIGIISLFSIFCCCPFVVSAIGITLALLSKGASETLKPKAKTGLILSICGIFTSIVMIIATVVMPFVLAKLNPEIKENFKEQYKEILEENEDFYKDMYGDDTYDMVEDFLDDL